MNTELKYEHIQIGTEIKAYDFESMTGRTERFIKGVIIETMIRHGAKFFVVECHFDSMVRDGDNPELAGRTGSQVLVPMETDGDEYWEHKRVWVIQNEIKFRTLSG